MIVRATVITDASFCHRLKAAGWAGWVRIDGQPLIKEAGRLTPCATSTEAEVKAALNGAWVAGRAGATHVLIQSDCMAVLHLINGRTKSPTLRQLWAEFRRLPLCAGLRVTGRHVKGHGPVIDRRTFVNDWCDREAGYHMRQQREELRRCSRK